ncbi:MAG: PTS sugar transporter subunit IIA [Planctomycetota bacterium]
MGRKLSELIHTESIISELTSTDRNGVIRELVQSLADHGAIPLEHADGISRKAIERENDGTTGFGNGVAVPHVKHAALTRMAATIGRSSRGIDFAALDRGPVFTVFLLVSPLSAPDDHLAAMESIFRCLQRESFRRFLRQADTHEAIIELIHEADES